MSVLGRLRSAFHAPPSAADADAALGALRFVRDGDDVVIAKGRGGEPLGAMGAARDVRLAKDVYATIPSAARRELLRLAKAAATRHVVVHVGIVDVGTHAARAFVDGPRALARSLGVAIAAPGERFPATGYVRIFSDVEGLVAELDAVGLVIVEQRGSTFVLARGDREWTDDASFATEVRRVLAILPLAERARRALGPRDAIAAMRRRGACERERSTIGRARLRRAVGWIDAITPSGGCYRRVLMELALDGGAARETLVFGLDVGRTGHVAFAGSEDVSFDVAFEVGPELDAAGHPSDEEGRT